MKENILPELNFPFVEEMKKFSLPYFPGKKAGSCRNFWHLKKSFPDEKMLLETGYDSCRRYMKAGGYEETSSDGYCLETIQKKTETFEEYTLSLTPGKCVIAANDTEGIRRGLYEFLDLFCANDGVLPEKEEVITRKPFLSIRLGRCPFSPIKRWPVNTDELLDDIDYYPDAYLETLARDGINGIWLVTQLQELGVSSFTQEDPHRKQRLAKLSRVAEKCSRYGIKVWLFMIEPFALPDDAPLYQKHPELFMRAKIPGMKNCFCPASESTIQYLREITKDIFSSVPALGGIVDIVYGERPTTCPSTKFSHDDSPILCQDQCKLNTNEIMQKALQAISDGIKAGSKKAKLIAWYYMPHTAPLASFCRNFAKYTPEDVIAQFNFESGGEKIQLGKKHCAGDYWVSYEGPAERYREAALQRTNGPMGAKLQLGCGHELTAVPYIPVPEIAYNKYKAMHDLNVKSVMQSWYIGNFPGLMEQACGRLAFEDFTGSKEEFLLRLARPFWGKYAKEVIQAWSIFNKAYQLFPFSLLFQYYAPQNAFMMWKYHFLPDLDPLAPPWKPNFEFGGDTIGEAMAGFTLEDAAILMNEMSSEWKKGVEKLLPLKEIYKESGDHLRDIGNAELLGCLIQGTGCLLDFFLLRKRLYTEKLTHQEYTGIIEEMKELLSQHKKLCRDCIPLLEADSRLGYHGEALCRIFDEVKTAKAIEIAGESLKEAEQLLTAVKNGMTPLQYAEKKILDILPQNTEQKGKGFSWSWKITEDKFILNIYDLPPGKDFWGKVYFIDLTGTSFPLQDVFNIENGQCIRKENIRAILIGENFDSGFTLQYNSGSLVAAWPLSSIPGAMEDKMFRFTFFFAADGTGSLVKGEGGTGRLYLGNIKACETYTLYM